MSSLALFLLIFPLAEGRARGWPTELVVMIVASIPVAIVFVLYENRLGKRGGDPVLRLELFRDRAFAVGAALAFVFFGTLTSLIFTISLTLQFGFGFSPLRAGVMTLPWAVGMGVAAVFSSVGYKVLGNRMLVLGMLVFAGSLLSLGAVLGKVGTDPSWLSLAGPLLIGGAGLGLFVALLQTAVLATVQPRHAGSVSGLLPTVQQVGSSIGLALIGVVFFSLVAGNAPAAVQGERDNYVETLDAAGLSPGIRDIAEKAFVDCASSQLESGSPMTVAPHCASQGSAPASSQSVQIAVHAAYSSTRSAAGEAFLQAQRRVLTIISMIALAIALASLGLPKVNVLVADGEDVGQKTL